MLPHVPYKKPRFFSAARKPRRDRHKYRRASRWRFLWCVLGTDWAPKSDCRCVAPGNPGDSAVGLLAHRRHAGHRGLRHAVHGAGRLGSVPAHLNELSPPAVRGTFPGFAYQLGNLLSSKNSVIQARIAEQRYGGNFAPVLAGTVLIVAVLVAIVTMSGREARGADLSHTRPGRQPA
jgi:hypothetical protein